MLRDFLEAFTRLRRHAEPDGLGGTFSTYTEGERFEGGVASRDGALTEPGTLQTLVTTQVLVHEPGLDLMPGDRIRRVRDGAEFRVLGHSEDMHTPACACLQYAQTPVERLVNAP